MEGLAKSNESIATTRCCGKLLSGSVDPPDARDASLFGDPITLGEHGRVGIEADCFLKQMGKSDGEDAGAAASIEQPPGPIETQFVGEDGFKLG